MGKMANWKIVAILYVAGAVPEQVATVIEPKTNVGGETQERIKLADNGVLVVVRDTDPDAGEVMSCLISKFGQDRVVDASQVRPKELPKWSRQEEQAGTAA